MQTSSDASGNFRVTFYRKMATFCPDCSFTLFDYLQSWCWAWAFMGIYTISQANLGRHMKQELFFYTILLVITCWFTSIIFQKEVTLQKAHAEILECNNIKTIVIDSDPDPFFNVTNFIWIICLYILFNPLCSCPWRVLWEWQFYIDDSIFLVTLLTL